MKIIKLTDIRKVPASHENPDDPGVLKQVLAGRDDLFEGRVQMINWATLLPGKTFAPHFHEDMQELFIMLGQGAVARVNGQEIVLQRGDTLVVDPGQTHEMANPTGMPIEYLVVGIAGDKKGKSINVNFP